jgi:hypothetical protein
MIRHAEIVGMRAQKPGNSLSSSIIHTTMKIPRNPNPERRLDKILFYILIFV